MRLKLLLLLLVIRGGLTAPAQGMGFPEERYLKHFSKPGIVFALDDPIRLPQFWWPRTLLRYRVAFDGSHVRPGDLRLWNPVPARLSRSNFRL